MPVHVYLGGADNIGEPRDPKVISVAEGKRDPLEHSFNSKVCAMERVTCGAS